MHSRPSTATGNAMRDQITFTDMFQMGCVPCTALYTGLLRVPAQTPLVSAYLLRQDIMVIKAQNSPIGTNTCRWEKPHIPQHGLPDSQHWTYKENLQALCMHLGKRLLYDFVRLRSKSW